MDNYEIALDRAFREMRVEASSRLGALGIKFAGSSYDCSLLVAHSRYRSDYLLQKFQHQVQMETTR